MASKKDEQYAMLVATGVPLDQEGGVAEELRHLRDARQAVAKAAWFRLADQALLDRDDLAESLGQMHRGEGRVVRDGDIPEPPDGTRIEFTHDTDVYAAWRNDGASAEAGWTTGDGGEVWCLYGETVPMTWTTMLKWFGSSLRDAVRLVPDSR